MGRGGRTRQAVGLAAQLFQGGQKSTCWPSRERLCSTDRARASLGHVSRPHPWRLRGVRKGSRWGPQVAGQLWRVGPEAGGRHQRTHAPFERAAWGCAEGQQPWCECGSLATCTSSLGSFSPPGLGPPSRRRGPYSTPSPSLGCCVLAKAQPSGTVASSSDVGERGLRRKMVAQLEVGSIATDTSKTGKCQSSATHTAASATCSGRQGLLVPYRQAQGHGSFTFSPGLSLVLSDVGSCPVVGASKKEKKEDIN